MKYSRLKKIVQENRRLRFEKKVYNWDRVLRKRIRQLKILLCLHKYQIWDRESTGLKDLPSKILICKKCKNLKIERRK